MAGVEGFEPSANGFGVRFGYSPPVLANPFPVGRCLLNGHRANYVVLPYPGVL